MENTQINEELEKKEEMATENTAASESATAEDQSGAEVAKLKEEVASSKDKYLRLYSEFENFRRRTAKEKLEMVQSANEQLIKALIPVLDDFERAEKSFAEKNDKDAEGFFLIQSKFRKVLDLYGVKVMDVKQGSDFNTDLHEAITQVPSPDPSLKGKVVDVVEKGYLLSDKVVRFAKVVVGS
ncbi:MAG TPA: nucleotide exchange factor GrpE [Chryseosolibacter sp.]